MLTPELLDWDIFFISLHRSENLPRNTTGFSSLDTRFQKGAASRIYWAEDLWLWLP